MNAAGTNDVLERYLDQISHYLAAEPGAREILAEIRSHIVEKAEAESGRTDPDAIRRAIAAYGTPREVAGKYLEGQAVIAPEFRAYLFRYTAILAAIHICVAAVGFAFHASIFAFPFFFIPKMNLAEAILYIPMAVIYDFGLVALLLYLVTRSRRDARLPWPRAGRIPRDGSGSVLKPPRLRGLVVHLAVFAVLLFFFIRFHTIFWYSTNGETPRMLLNPASSVLYSLLFLAMMACRTCEYAVRFVVNSVWVRLVTDGLILALLWVVWNIPVRLEIAAIPGFNLRLASGLFVLVLVCITALRFLWDLVLITSRLLLRRAA